MQEAPLSVRRTGGSLGCACLPSHPPPPPPCFPHPHLPSFSSIPGLLLSADLAVSTVLTCIHSWKWLHLPQSPLPPQAQGGGGAFLGCPKGRGVGWGGEETGDLFSQLGRALESAHLIQVSQLCEVDYIPFMDRETESQ